MHIEKELSEKLSQLKTILSEMKALLQWQKLKAFENSRNPSTRLVFSDDTPQQVSSNYSNFLSLSAQIDHILRTNHHIAKRVSIVKELDKLYCQLYYLGTDVRVY
ncbi:MAG: hypothetical protein PHF37_01825 [Phycisphaerae bacterium]|nr:hypothetical protein [Phycisphaerae bacterium]